MPKISTSKSCTRCGSTIEPPVKDHAKYVRGDDMIQTEQRPGLVALKHTDETRDARDKIAAVNNLSATQANLTLVRGDENYLKEVGPDGEVVYDYTALSRDDFITAIVDEPINPEHDPEVVITEQSMIEKQVQKTGLVCPDCVRETDEIIW